MQAALAADAAPGQGKAGALGAEGTLAASHPDASMDLLPRWGSRVRQGCGMQTGSLTVYP